MDILILFALTNMVAPGITEKSIIFSSVLKRNIMPKQVIPSHVYHHMY